MIIEKNHTWDEVLDSLQTVLRAKNWNQTIKGSSTSSVFSFCMVQAMKMLYVFIYDYYYELIIIIYCCWAPPCPMSDVGLVVGHRYLGAAWTTRKHSVGREWHKRTIISVNQNYHQTYLNNRNYKFMLRFELKIQQLCNKWGILKKSGGEKSWTCLIIKWMSLWFLLNQTKIN